MLMPHRKSRLSSPTDVRPIFTSSTPIGDRIERQTIAQLFPSDRCQIVVSSTKGHTGHLLGAAGALESIFTLLACYHGLCPSTLNYQNDDDSFHKK